MARGSPQPEPTPVAPPPDLTVDTAEVAKGNISKVLGGDEPAYSETPAAALPEDRRQASRLLWRLRNIRRQKEEVIQTYDEVFEELGMQRAEQLRPLETAEAWLEQALALWHHARRNEDPKATTIKLPGGTLKSTDAKAKWEYLDEPGFVAWATAQKLTDALRTPEVKTTIDRDNARKLLADDKIEVNEDGSVVWKETGEKIPGLRVTPGGDYDLGRFYKAQT